MTEKKPTPLEKALAAQKDAVKAVREAFKLKPCTNPKQVFIHQRTTTIHMRCGNCQNCRDRLGGKHGLDESI